VARGPDPETATFRILQEFVVSPEPAFIASEIAEELDISDEGARHRLNRLVEQGLLNKKKPGPRTVIYWITEKGEVYYAEHAE